MTNGRETATHEIPPALSVLRSSQDRDLEREGIPMILALVSEVGATPAVRDERSRVEGEALAEAMDRYRTDLVPSSRDDDLGCLISVLQAVAYDDVAAPAAPLAGTAAEVASRRVVR